MSEPNAYDRLRTADRSLELVMAGLPAERLITIEDSGNPPLGYEFKFCGCLRLNGTAATYLCKVINDRMDELKTAAVHMARMDQQQALHAAQEEVGPVCDMVPREHEHAPLSPERRREIEEYLEASARAAKGQ